MDDPPPFCDAGTLGSPPGMQNTSWDHLWSLCTACESGPSGACFTVKCTSAPLRQNRSEIHLGEVHPRGVAPAFRLFIRPQPHILSNFKSKELLSNPTFLARPSSRSHSPYYLLEPSSYSLSAARDVSESVNMPACWRMCLGLQMPDDSCK